MQIKMILHEPPGSAVRAIEKAREQGHYVFLCTGRNYDMLSPLLKYGFDGVIASSGGHIRCGEKTIYDCPMTEEQKKKAMDILEKKGIFRTVECMDGSYTDEGFKDFLFHLCLLFCFTSICNRFHIVLSLYKRHYKL